MGGLGSGGWNLKHRGVVEAHRQIDAARLQREGCLEQGCFGTLRWTSQAGETNSTKISGGGDAIRLVCSGRVKDGDWTSIDERVALDWSPRRFGGAQAYFLCPQCVGRVRFLYGANLRFLCRKCHDLVHASKRERDEDRALRRMQKLRRRIGADIALNAPLAQKPKGMRWTTYMALLARVEDAERKVVDNAWRMLKRIQTRTETWPAFS